MTQMQMPFPSLQLTCGDSQHSTKYGIVTTESNDYRNESGKVVATSKKPKRKTYPQDWPAYNAAQTHEKEIFLYLLREICDTIPQPLYKRGRPRLPVSDILFSIAVKVFSTMSTRRVMSDVRDARAKALLDCIPSPASIFRYMEDPSLKPHLESMIMRTAAPLRTVEVDFSADASGFSSSVFSRWFDAKWGKERKAHEWVKTHIMVGIKTHVVTAAIVTPGQVADSPQLPELLETTTAGFNVREVSADMAYLSRRNLWAIHEAGAMPYIPFKSNSVGGQPGDRNFDPLWSKLYHYYSFYQDRYKAHYHKRSNVESTFSMVKRKFSNSVRTKMHDAQVNEILAKIVCHNICVVIQSVYELGIAPVFHLPTLEANGHSEAEAAFEAHSLNGAGTTYEANGTNGVTGIFDAEWPFAPKMPVKLG